MDEPVSLDLEPIKARCEVLGVDPWSTEDPGPYVHTIKGTDPEGRSYDVGKWLSPQVARFIVHARTDVPALVAEVERLRAALESHREYHRRMDERERDFYAGDVL